MAAQGGGTGRQIDSGENRKGAERGAAVVDFVLIGALLTLFFLAIVQLTLVLHVRNTLIDAAASGARYGTLADRNDGDAKERTVQLITAALNSDFARDVGTSESTFQGIRTLEVTVRAPLPVIGFIGPRALLEVKGHAAIQRVNGTPSPRRRRASPEQGSAVVEFVFLSALLMVPLVYFIITVGQIQGGSFAVVGAADQAAKVYVAQPDAASGRAAAEQAVLLALADYGQPAGNATRRHPLRACRLPGSRLGGDSHRPPHRAPAVCAVQRRTASEREPAQRVGNPTGGQVPVRGRPGPRRQEGQVLVLSIGFMLIALLVATVVMAASSVYLEHKKLLSLADGASVAAADSFTLGQLGNSGGTPSAVLSGARVRSAAVDYLGRNGAFERFSALSRGAVDGQPGRRHRRRRPECSRPPAGGELPGAGRHPDRGDVHGALPPQPVSRWPATPVALSVDAANQAVRQPKVTGQPGIQGNRQGQGARTHSVGLKNHGKH